jgi:hypothetical protein
VYLEQQPASPRMPVWNNGSGYWGAAPQGYPDVKLPHTWHIGCLVLSTCVQPGALPMVPVQRQVCDEEGAMQQAIGSCHLMHSLHGYRTWSEPCLRPQCSTHLLLASCGSPSLLQWMGWAAVTSNHGTLSIRTPARARSSTTAASCSSLLLCRCF